MAATGSASVVGHGQAFARLGVATPVLASSAVTAEVRRILLGMIDGETSPGGAVVQLRPGEELIRQGEDSGTVFVLMDGSLTVTRESEGQAVTMATIDDPGSVVGEMVALGGGVRSATVAALTHCELLEFDSAEFRDLLASRPRLANQLAALAVRRAEEGDLAEILAGYGVMDTDSVITTCAAVEWRRLVRGEVLFEEGAVSDAIYFVVRGRLLVSRYDSMERETVPVGEVGRGGTVGDIGLLGNTRRNATVVALRDTVVASLDEPAFLTLIDRQPRMMIELGLKAVSRARVSGQRSSPSTVLATVACDRLPSDEIVRGVINELGTHGSVRFLSPVIVESVLETEGAADAEPGEVGDVRISKLLHEAEVESDHLVLGLGDHPGPWTRRCLAMVDRVLVFVPPDLTDEEAAAMDGFFLDCPEGVHRTVVMVHARAGGAPVGTGRLMERLSAKDALHMMEGSSPDAGRVARVAVGRGTALALSGGGGRGFAHLGVVRALEELGVPIDIVGGTSIGGILASVIADGMSSSEAIEWARLHFPKSLDYTIPVVSLVKGSRIARSATESFGDRAIEDLWKTYFCVSTNLTASRPHVHDRGDLARAIRATSAIPGVMPPVPLGESLLVDGGVLNNLPIDVARGFAPAGRVIAVDVAPPRGPGARGDYGLAVSGWAALRSNIGSGRSDYPRISAVLLRSMITASMRERDGQVAAELADCYLDLDMRGVSMLAFDDPSGVAQRGYDAALPAIEAWLAAPSSSGV